MENLKGKVFGYMTVISVHHVGRNGKGAHWNCQCVCGTQKVLRGRDLKFEPTVNCGCQSERLRHERVTKHGNAVKGQQTKEYRAWIAMKSRCTCETHTEYMNYGGRGITVCPEWLDSFETFLKDMGPCPEGHTLDRKEVNEGYSPNNCRWASRTDQDRNKRNTVWVDWQGKRVQLRALSEQAELPRSRVYQQWKRGVPLETIFKVLLIN